MKLADLWDDALAMIRRDIDIIGAVAGMFLFLPGAISAFILPDPQPLPPEPAMNDLLAAQAAYVVANWPVIVAGALVAAFGSLTLIALLVNPRQPTVVEAMRIAAAILPIYLLANLMQSIPVAVGFFFFILPGLYLIARFICIGPVAAAEGHRNPVTLLVRSWQVTQGSGLRILFMLAVLLLVALVVSAALSAVVGIVAGLALPADIARLVTVLAGSLVESVLGVATLAVSAAVYRARSGGK